MDVVELTPQLFFLRFQVGHCYLSIDMDGLTLMDTGVPGSAAQLAEAIRGLGYEPAQVRRLLLTHFHIDHTGAAAEILAWGDVTVFAHHADAPMVRGQAAAPQPQLAQWERPLYEQVMGDDPEVLRPFVRVDAELDDGDELSNGMRVVAAPGHTPGSAAYYVPDSRVLIAGDAIAARGDGKPILGVFNANPSQAIESFRKLASLDVEIACFGHGCPLTENASGALRVAAEAL